jgi:glycosyltransferase involved in cell wall biosynthesis
MACVCGFIKKVPIIIAEETSDPQNRSRKADFLLRLLCIPADKVVAISPGTEQYLQKRAKIPIHKIQLINNGVDVPHSVTIQEIEKLKNHWRINNDDFIIGSVGRLENNVKKFTDIIKAIALLEKYQNLKLLIVGDGRDKKLILQTAEHLGVSNKLIMAGFQADTSPYYQLMDVFCLASQREGFGLVAAEAMFHQLPVVATSVGGLKSVVINNETGFLVPPNRPEAIAQKLEILINNPDLRKAFGMVGFHRAKTEYAPEVYVGKVDKMYQELYQKKIAKE